MKVTAIATRSGGWWAVEVPAVPGLFTQVRRLDQIDAEVADAAALLGIDDIEITVKARLDPIDEAALETARARKSELSRAEAAAAEANRSAAARLRDEGLPVRDIGTLMGVSPQRVSALMQTREA